MSRNRTVMQQATALAVALEQVPDDIKPAFKAVMNAAETDSKITENIRANHRNLNRMIMLVMTLVMMFTFVGILKAIAPGLTAFAAPLALVPDFVLALYSMVRKY